MCYRGQLTEILASNLNLSVSEVWEVLESLRLAWSEIDSVPCATIDDLPSRIEPQTLAGIVELMAQRQTIEVPDRQVA